MRAPPRLYLACPTGPFFARDPAAVLELARLAESSGITALRLPDHVVMGPRTDRYSWGPFAYPVDVPWLDPLVTIAAMSAVTSRLRFCTSILIAPLRPAAVLAKMAATIDVLSGGRLELGVGTGWQEEEFVACGARFEDRGVALTDAIRACRALWGPSPATFRSESLSFDDIWCEPKPVQRGGIPVFFSGTLHPRNLERIVTLGDGWIPIMDETVSDLEQDVATLRTAWHEGGRDEDALRIHARLDIIAGRDGTPDLGKTFAGAHVLLDLGVTDLQLATMPFMSEPSDMPRFFDELGSAWSSFNSALTR